MVAVQGRGRVLFLSIRYVSDMAITDFGAKIGGARKDLRGTFTKADLDGLNHAERLKLVRKDMVWPTPDYAKLVEDGEVDAKTAAMIKQVRDSLPASPMVYSTANEEDYAKACESYIEVVNTVQATIRGQKTIPGITAALLTDQNFREIIGDVSPKSDVRFGENRVVASFKESERYRAFEKANGALDYSTRSSMHTGLALAGQGSLSREMVRLFRKNPEWPQATGRVHTAIREHNLNPVENPDGTWSIGVYSSRMDPSNYGYYTRRTPFGAVLGKTFESAELAKEALIAAGEEHFKAKHLEKKAKRDAVVQRARVTNPEDVGYRVGPDQRDGYSATGEHYLLELGMRGGEFGNWVNDSERQQVLDRGYDAYCDLADTLGWDRTQISIGGTQAIAFGSRGRGGRNAAAAHYEPMRTVTNLTKPAGEGCLSHEWGHALDHYMGERAIAIGLTIPYADGAHFLSHGRLTTEHLQRVAEADRPEAEKLIELSNAMNRLDRVSEVPSVEEYRAQLQRSLDRAMESSRSAISSFGIGVTDLARWNKHSADEISRISNEAKSLVEAILADPSLSDWESRVKQAVSTTRAQVGRRGSWTYHEERLMEAFGSVAMWTHALADTQQPGFTPPARERFTDYHNACRALDRDTGHKKSYYALPEEMFARGFEATVEDWLRANDRRNPYLVSGTSGAAFPAGDERARATSELLEKIQALGAFIPVLERKRVHEMPVKMELEDLASQQSAEVTTAAPVKEDVVVAEEVGDTEQSVAVAETKDVAREEVRTQPAEVHRQRPSQLDLFFGDEPGSGAQIIANIERNLDGLMRKQRDVSSPAI